MNPFPSNTLALAAALALAAFGASAQEKPLAIVDATLFDATGSAPHVGSVVLHKGRIIAIGPQVKAPRGATVIKAKGKALLPGLFDLHTHWTPNSTPSVLPGIATAYLATGVTTVNDFHQPPESFAPRRQWLKEVAAPHVNFVARFSTPLGHGADWADENTTRWVNSPEAARRAVEEVVTTYQPDLIKAFTDGWRYGMSADNTSMDVSTLSALVEQAHKHDVRVLTHTVTVDRGRVAAQAKVDVIAHALQDKPVDAETVALLKASGTYYAPTLAVYEPNRPGSPALPADDPRTQARLQKFDYALQNVKTLFDAGVPVAVGTDAGMFPHQGATARELELLVRAGLSPAQALIAGTATSAAAIGLDQDRGTLQVGKRADLILVDGRPWENISDVRKVERVFVDGEQRYGKGVKLPAANAALAPAALPVAALVDDFERADGRTALDTLRVDEADGGPDRTVQVTEVVAREQGGNALSLQARFSSKPQPFASAILPLSRGSVAPADLRAYSGLSFDIRGDTVPVTLEYRGVDNRGWTAATFTPQAGWQRVEIPFSALQPKAPRGGGAAPAWQGNDVQQIVFTVGGSAGEKVWLELDNVRFY